MLYKLIVVPFHMLKEREKSDEKQLATIQQDAETDAASAHDQLKASQDALLTANVAIKILRGQLDLVIRARI